MCTNSGTSRFGEGPRVPYTAHVKVWGTSSCTVNGARRGLGTYSCTVHGARRGLTVLVYRTRRNLKC